MKQNAVLWIIIFKAAFAFSQLHDAQWMHGPLTSFLDFRDDTVRTYGGTKFMNTKLTNACISDEQGGLLFYTNGLYINDRNGSLLKNGDSLSPCPESSRLYNEGLPMPQAALFLPMSNNSNYYYLFHFSYDTFYTGPGNGRPGTLFYSIIDKRGNNGLGEVVDKNYVFAKGVFRGGGMTACKHANGRDWWILVGNWNSNQFSTFLLTPAGVTASFVQASGPVYNGPFDIAYSNFSLDGSRYVTGAAEGYVTVFDFDRCSGLLSNPLTIHNNASGDPINDPITGTSSVAFSPNGKLLFAIYVFGNKQGLVQYDLTSTNVQMSADTLYKPDSNDNAKIGFVGLAPNGKLYGSTWGGGWKALHVVNRPDERGDSALFVRLGQPTLSANSFNLPNLPNYRLGALAGSGCDTLYLDLKSQKERAKTIQVFPNPATDAVTVDYGSIVWERYNIVSLKLTNAIGQVVYESVLPKYSGLHKVDVSGLPAGLYHAEVFGDGRMIGVSKVVKE